MVNKKEIKKQILVAITDLGPNIATIKQIEKKVPLERHALSKYLHLMKKEGLLDYHNVGKAKVWHINQAPILTVLKNLPDEMTFNEQILFDIITTLPIGLILIDKHFKILFLNDFMKKTYGDIEGKLLYKSVFQYKNPLNLKQIIEVIDKQKKRSSFRVKDNAGNILRINVSRFINPNDNLSVILLIRNITEDHERKKELLLIKDFFRTLLNQNEKPLIMTDKNGKIVEANVKGAKLFGYDRRINIIGMDSAELLEIHCNFNLPVQDEQRFSCKIKTNKMSIKARAYPVKEKNNNLRGTIFFFQE